MYQALTGPRSMEMTLTPIDRWCSYFLRKRSCKLASMMLIIAAIFVFSTIAIAVTFPSLTNQKEGLQSESECVPICFRSDQPLIETRENVVIHAEIESQYMGEPLVAYSRISPYLYVSILGTCYIAPKSDLIAGDCWIGRSVLPSNIYTAVMTRAAAEMIGNQTEEMSILIMGHGIGELIKFQLDAFPNAKVDSMDIDDAIITASREWFCFMDEAKVGNNEKINIYNDDAIQYLNELEEEDKVTYDVIYFDAYKGCALETSFEIKPFFERVRTLWTRWNRIQSQCRPRVLMVNAFLPSLTLQERPIFKAAEDVFGRDALKCHSTEIFSISSPVC